MKRENGNALFLILIAVALFAALSYAITNSGRSGGSIDKEQLQIATAQLAQYIASIETAVQRMQIINGCRDTDISMQYDSSGNGVFDTDGSDEYYNNNTPFDCYVFHPSGGGLTYQTFDGVYDTSQSAKTKFNELFFTDSTRINGLGTSNSELILIVPWVTQEVCELYNEKNAPDLSSIQEAGAAYDFTYTANGAFSDPAIHDIDTFDGRYNGIYSACFQGASNNPQGGYHIYSVLLVR